MQKKKKKKKHDPQEQSLDNVQLKSQKLDAKVQDLGDFGL